MILDPDQPFLDKAQRLSSWGHWFTFFNILLALVLSSSFIVTDGWPTTLVGFAYLLTNWIGHTAFLTFILFVITIFPLSIIFPYPRHIRGMASILATSGMVLLAIDAYSYSRLGYHISGSSLEQVFTLLTKTWNDHPTRKLSWVLGISGAILIYELLASNFTWKRLERLRDKACGRLIVSVFLTAFVSSHVIHVFADAALNYDVMKQNNMFPFSYPATAKTLLAKNGLLDRQQYEQAQADQLALRQNLEFTYRHQPLSCKNSSAGRHLAILQLKGTLDDRSLAKLSDSGLIPFTKHYVPTDFEDAVFNLIYGLPSIYKNSIVANRLSPHWLEVAQESGVKVTIDFAQSPDFAPYLYLNATLKQTDAATEISMSEVNTVQLFDRLQTLNNSDVIIIGQAENAKMAIAKAPLLIRIRGMRAYDRQVTQNLGVNATVIESWLSCTTTNGDRPDVFGKNLLRKTPKVLAANYTAGTIVSIKKDRIILLDDQGNDMQLSASNGYKLDQQLDIPTLNDTINLLKRYSVTKAD